jgi:hypothetical protein
MPVAPSQTTNTPTPEELEKQYALEVDEQRHKQRLHNLKTQALKKTISSEGKGVVVGAARKTALRYTLLYVIPFLAVACLLFVLVASIPMMINKFCTDDSWGSWFRRGAAYVLTLGKSAEVCNQVGEVFEGFQSGTNPGIGGSGYDVKPLQPPPIIPGSYTDAEARAALSGAGITWNKNCIDQLRNLSQTCLNGIKISSINELITFKQNCDAWKGTCTVILTGGTEPGHAIGNCSHGAGYKIDIDDTPSVNKYILAKDGAGKYINFATAGTRSTTLDPLYRYLVTGTIYAQESNHWDIGGISCNWSIKE